MQSVPADGILAYHLLHAGQVGLAAHIYSPQFLLWQGHCDIGQFMLYTEQEMLQHT